MICVSSIELFVIFLAVLWNGNIKPMAINSHNLKRGIIGELPDNRHRRFEDGQMQRISLHLKWQKIVDIHKVKCYTLVRFLAKPIATETTVERQ